MKGVQRPSAGKRGTGELVKRVYGPVQERVAL